MNEPRMTHYVAEGAEEMKRLAYFHFLYQSNQLEDVVGVTNREIDALEALLSLKQIGAGDLLAFTLAFNANARVRDQEGMTIWAPGKPPPGGPQIGKDLEKLLVRATEAGDHPWDVHVQFMRLRPFTHSNGAAGRALWLWGMDRRGLFAAPKFLTLFYEQTLERS